MRTPAIKNQLCLFRVHGKKTLTVPTVIFDILDTVSQENDEFFWYGVARALVD